MQEADSVLSTPRRFTPNIVAGRDVETRQRDPLSVGAGRNKNRPLRLE
jgi:hypothetical protein